MRTSLFFLLGLIVLVPLSAFAQSNNTFVPLLPSLPGIKEFAASPSLPNLLNNIYKICIGIAAVLAVLQIMRGGIIYMGGDSITEKKEARDLITMSIVGLLLVLSPVIVFSIINPKILNLDINAKNLTTAPVSTASSSVPSTTPGSTNACSNYGTPSAVPTSVGCSTVGGGLYDNAPSQCCAGLQSGYQCCAIPK